MPPLMSLHLRRVLFRCFSSSLLTTRQYHNTLPPIPSIYPANLTSFPSISSRPFTSESNAESKVADPCLVNPIAVSVSAELLKNTNEDPLSVSQRLRLGFSHITPDSNLVRETLNLSPEAGRNVLGFSQWLVSNPSFDHTDETLSFFVEYLGRRKDFKATHEIMVDNKSVIGVKTIKSAIDRLVRAGRPTQAVAFFEKMEVDYGFKRDRESLSMVVEKLTENGFASYAEKMVKTLANEIFPDENICDLLVKGWCVDGKLDEAKRLAGEMYRGGFEIGTMAYNSLLDCVCKVCRLKDPFRLRSEAESVLLEMDRHGVPRNVETFNVLIDNLCKIRKTEDAMKLFDKMGQWGCYPNAATYLIMIRSLYQAARVGEGDEMIDKMKSAGFGDSLDKKAYYGFLTILCGIERIDHAMSVFKKMKNDGCKPGIKTYDLLMGKWCAHNRLDRANALYNQALKNDLAVTPKEYRVDPLFIKKKKKNVKTEKKRETFPEKMAKKRTKLKKIRLSFVKKSTRSMRRAY